MVSLVFVLQATAGLMVVERLESVVLLVENRTSDVFIQKNKPTRLEALVTPRGAVHNARFLWFIGSSKPRIRYSNVYIHRWSRNVVLSVRVENGVSNVSSAKVKATVVERIEGVRGVADHDSVLAGHPRDYTVLVNRGSHISYTWDFGDGTHPVTTTRATQEHTYDTPGTYNLFVNLTTPLGDAVVVSSTVFVLASGVCDTPEVLQFFPRDIATDGKVSVKFSLFHVSAARRLPCPMAPRRR